MLELCTKIDSQGCTLQASSAKKALPVSSLRTSAVAALGFKKAASSYVGNAFKGLSQASGASDQQKQRPGWLYSVAVCSSAAAVFGCFNEEAPITGRRQLLFRFLRASDSSCCKQGSVPQLAMLSAGTKYGSPSEQQLHKQGSQLMQTVYHSLSMKGLQTLAAHSPALQQRLAKLPAAMHLSHSLATAPQARYVDYDIPDEPEPVGCMHINTTAGILLQQQSPEGLGSIMNHELGHGVA